MTDRRHLPGGSGGVWYEKDPVFGRIVHRPTGPWTSAVHEYLRFLRQAAIDGIPEVIGIDSHGDEMLAFVPGQTPAPESGPSMPLLASAAAWLRRFHDAAAGFRPDGPRVWRQGSSSLAPRQIVCHNDPGTYNWLVDGDTFVGLIDWDQAGPGDPLDDLAFLCWTAVPLFRPIGARDAAHRVATIAHTYGGIPAATLLDAVAVRMMGATQRIAAGIERGDPGMLSLQENGEPARTRGRVEDFLDRLPEIRAGLLG